MNYSFEAKYEIDVNHSELFQTVYKESTTDLMKHFGDNENQVHIDNEGRIKMFYVNVHNHKHGAHHKDTPMANKDSKDDDSDPNALQECNIYGSIF